MQPFTARAIAIIKDIPAGAVATYGQVAAQAGSARAARQVVRILHSLSEKHDLPWHRIVNARGEIALQDEEGRYMQALYLRQEGVEVSAHGQIDLARFGYRPGRRYSATSENQGSPPDENGKPARR